MFAYCGNNPVMYCDSTGALFEKNYGGGGGLLTLPHNFLNELIAPFKDALNVTAQAIVTGAAALAGVDALRQEMSALHEYNRKQVDAAIADGLTDIAKSYPNFECKAAARSMADYLKKNKEHGEVLLLEIHGGRGRIYSLSKKTMISETGIHVGVKYGGRVYCNVHPYGLPELQWINDFEGFGNKTVTPFPIP